MRNRRFFIGIRSVLREIATFPMEFVVLIMQLGSQAQPASGYKLGTQRIEYCQAFGTGTLLISVNAVGAREDRAWGEAIQNGFHLCNTLHRINCRVNAVDICVDDIPCH